MVGTTVSSYSQYLFNKKVSMWQALGYRLVVYDELVEETHHVRHGSTFKLVGEEELRNINCKVFHLRLTEHSYESSLNYLKRV